MAWGEGWWPGAQGILALSFPAGSLWCAGSPLLALTTLAFWGTRWEDRMAEKGHF